VLIIPVRGERKPPISALGRARPDEALLAWMREFSLKTDRPFFYERSGERFGFGPRDFQMEMLAKLDRASACGSGRWAKPTASSLDK